jgi:hypothetical protein
MVGPSPSALWSRVSQAAYLESDTPHGPPFTGRQFTNDQIYWNAFAQHELVRPGNRIEGIVHFVRMRRDRATAQLAQLRGTWARGVTGAEFTGLPEPLPAACAQAVETARRRASSPLRHEGPGAAATSVVPAARRR